MGPRAALRATWMPLLALALTVFAPTLQAQQLRVRVEADTSLVAVGDRIELTVRVEHPPGARVLWPDSLDLAPFEVLGGSVLPTTTDGAIERSSARFALTVFELGALEIPSFPIDVLGAGDEVTTLETDAWGVEVVSVGLDEDGAVRGIKGPLMIARGWVSLLPGLLLALALIVFGIWMLRRKPADDARTLGPVRMHRPAHEIAYEELDELERSRLLVREEIKEYHVRVSEIIRTYIEGRYDVRALEMTTYEVVDGLGRVGIEGPLLEAFRGFLERADLVKFAKYRPSEAASKEMLDRARELVDQTRPRMMEYDEAPDTPGHGPEADGHPDAGGDEPGGPQDGAPADSDGDVPEAVEVER